MRIYIYTFVEGLPDREAIRRAEALLGAPVRPLPSHDLQCLEAEVDGLARECTDGIIEVLPAPFRPLFDRHTGERILPN